MAIRTNNSIFERILHKTISTAETVYSYAIPAAAVVTSLASIVIGAAKQYCPAIPPYASKRYIEKFSPVCQAAGRITDFTVLSGIETMAKMSETAFKAKIYLSSISALFSLTPDNTEKVKQKLSAISAQEIGYHWLGGFRTLIHESGHAFMAMTLYNTNPKIVIHDYINGGGATAFDISSPTLLGNSLGPIASRAIVSAGGPFIDILSSTMALGASILLKDSHPIAAGLAEGYAWKNITELFGYALSGAFTPKYELGHDFVSLEAFGGIHPLAAAAAVAAIPCIAYLGILLSKNQSKKLGGA